MTLLTNDVEGLLLEDLQVSAGRDGFDIVSSRKVKIHNVHVSGGTDDTLAIKTDFSTGKVIASHDIHVFNSHFSSVQCNALTFGSETVGDIRSVHFENISISYAGKA